MPSSCKEFCQQSSESLASCQNLQKTAFFGLSKRKPVMEWKLPPGKEDLQVRALHPFTHSLLSAFSHLLVSLSLLQQNNINKVHQNIKVSNHCAERTRPVQFSFSLRTPQPGSFTIANHWFQMVLEISCLLMRTSKSLSFAFMCLYSEYSCDMGTRSSFWGLLQEAKSNTDIQWQKNKPSQNTSSPDQKVCLVWLTILQLQIPTGKVGRKG